MLPNDGVTDWAVVPVTTFVVGTNATGLTYHSLNQMIINIIQISIKHRVIRLHRILIINIVGILVSKHLIDIIIIRKLRY